MIPTHWQGGNTALIMASKNDWLEVVKVLSTRGADLNAKEFNVSPGEQRTRR